MYTHYEYAARNSLNAWLWPDYVGTEGGASCYFLFLFSRVVGLANALKNEASLAVFVAATRIELQYIFGFKQYYWVDIKYHNNNALVIASVEIATESAGI